MNNEYLPNNNEIFDKEKMIRSGHLRFGWNKMSDVDAIHYTDDGGALIFENKFATDNLSDNYQINRAKKHHLASPYPTAYITTRNTTNVYYTDDHIIDFWKCEILSIDANNDDLYNKIKNCKTVAELINTYYDSEIFKKKKDAFTNFALKQKTSLPIRKVKKE